jgi:hypothetical protein
MSAPGSAPWMPGSGSRWRASAANPDLRVSDAERAEVADRLSKHYADGRLGQAEFDERLDQAMNATTQSDLSGLLADLPDTETSHAPDLANAPKAPRVPPERHGRSLRHILFLVLFVVIAAALGQALVHIYIPWLLIALVLFLWLRFRPWQHRRR